MNKNYFDFLYIIGRGGFGKVWKVKLKKTNEYFALKEMSKMKIIDRRSEISIMSEKTLLSKLHNPFIVNMYFTFQDFSNLYLVMDLLTGGDLRYHIAKKKRFSERETKFFIANMLLALEYIHSKNIIHRDIKPENLVLELNGYLRITDFGVAKINEKDNSSETSGTPGYMAPEVILVQNHSFPSDFFALGVIGYEFMLGYRPYLGGSRKEIKELIIYKQARLDESDIPYSWSLESGDFINKLLKRKPSKRLGYHGVKEIKNHLWMRDINWDLLKKKEITAPFIPNPNKENFDKAYCERVEEIGETTIERYQEYAESELFQEVFEGYTYINVEYLKFKNRKKKEKNEKKEKKEKKKKKEENKKKLRIESSTSRIKKNYSTNLTGQKKSISISQENFNSSNKHSRLKINLRKRNQNSNKDIKQIYPTPKKQTIDYETKKEVLKRMTINDNIKTNKNYLSNRSNFIDNNKNESDLKLKYNKEKLKKRALKIASKMNELKNKGNININLNLNSKKSTTKKFVLNKSNSMKILNSIKKDSINNNLENNFLQKNNSKNKDNKIPKTIKKSSSNKINVKKKKEIKKSESKNQIIVEKKKSYNLSLNIKDKQLKNDETIHKNTYNPIKKNKKIKSKENISHRIKNDDIKARINEEKEKEKQLKEKIHIIEEKRKERNILIIKDSKIKDNNKKKENIQKKDNIIQIKERLIKNEELQKENNQNKENMQNNQNKENMQLKENSILKEEILNENIQSKKNISNIENNQHNENISIKDNIQNIENIRIKDSIQNKENIDIKEDNILKKLKMKETIQSKENLQNKEIIKIKVKNKENIKNRNDEKIMKKQEKLNDGKKFKNDKFEENNEEFLQKINEQNSIKVEKIKENDKNEIKIEKNNKKEIKNKNEENNNSNNNIDLTDNKENEKEKEIKNENIRKPQSKIMLWIQKSLPFNVPEDTNNKKYSTIDNNICKNINKNDNNTINIDENIRNPEQNKNELNNKKEIDTIKNIDNKNENNNKKENNNNKKENNKVIENSKKDKNNNKIMEKNNKFEEKNIKMDEKSKIEKYKKEKLNNLKDIKEIINKEINLLPSDITNKKNYKTIIIDTNNKYKSNKNNKKKHYKSSKRFYFSKNNSCPNIYFDKQNIITKEIKVKGQKSTFVVFNTININLGNTTKNFKRNRTPKMQVIKNINNSLKNIYLSNDFLIEPMKFNSYLDKKILPKSKEHFSTKKTINTVKDKKFKEFKRRNINNKNIYSEYIKSI